MDHRDKREATFGLLPLELLEQVLNEAWLSWMTPTERAHFSEAVSLASPIWAATLDKICAMHVYSLEPDIEFPKKRNHMCMRSSQIGGPGVPAIYLCKTFTRQIPSTKSYLSSRSMPRKALKEMLATFRGLPFVPSLRTLSVEFFDQGFDYQRISSISFALHASIIKLDVEYTISSTTPTWVVEALGLLGNKEQQQTKYAPCALPELYHISTPCDGPASFGSVLQLCPHLELTEDNFGLEMRILNSSDKFESHWTIVHGPLSMSVFLDNYRDRPGYATLRGHALGLVFDFKKTKIKSQSPNFPRQVGILRRRVGPY